MTDEIRRPVVLKLQPRSGGAAGQLRLSPDVGRLLVKLERLNSLKPVVVKAIEGYVDYLLRMLDEA